MDVACVFCGEGTMKTTERRPNYKPYERDKCGSKIKHNSIFPAPLDLNAVMKSDLWIDGFCKHLELIN